MFRYLLTFVLLLFFTSCTNKSNTSIDDKPGNELKPILNCSASPPILDRSKIAVMLTNNGTITSAMGEEEIDKIVSDFINRKNKAFKDCKKWKK